MGKSLKGSSLLQENKQTLKIEGRSTTGEKKKIQSAKHKKNNSFVVKNEGTNTFDLEAVDKNKEFQKISDIINKSTHFNLTLYNLLLLDKKDDPQVANPIFLKHLPKSTKDTDLKSLISLHLEKDKRRKSIGKPIIPSTNSNFSLGLNKPSDISQIKHMRTPSYPLVKTQNFIDSNVASGSNKARPANSR